MNDELKDALAAWAVPNEDHPGPEELAAYQAGELPPKREEALRDHLTGCAECASLLLELEAFSDPDFTSPPLAGAALADKEAVWSRLREEITPAEAPVVPFPLPPSQRPSPRLPNSSRWLQALAASLLVATLGLSLWVASLRRRVAELSRPEPNAPVVDLYATEVRGADGTAVPVVSRNARFFTLLLNSAGQTDHPRYRVEIQRADGTTVFQDDDVSPLAFGSFSLTLPRLPSGPGDYRVRLFGVDGGRATPLEDYAFRVE